MADLLFPDELAGSLYFDALNGSFFPAASTLRETQTLQELAKTAFDKGTLVDDYLGGELTGFKHSPAWAPEVQAIIWCDLGRKTVALVGMTLQHQQGNELSVFGPEPGSADSTINLMTPDLDVELPLLAGDPLLVVRDILADHAQAFFNQGL